MIIPTKTVQTMLQGLNDVLRSYPSQKLPVNADHWAWVNVVRSVCPSGMGAQPSTVAAICTGQTRPYNWRDSRLTALRQYFDKVSSRVQDDQSESDSDQDKLVRNRNSQFGITPASLSYLHSKGRPFPNILTHDNPVSELNTLRERFELAVLQVDADTDPVTTSLPDN